MNKKILNIVLCLLICASLSACGSSSDSSTDGTNASTSGQTIPDKWEAESVADFVDNICGSINYPTTSKASSFNADYTDYILDGTTGSVMVNGTNERNYSSTSSSVNDTTTLDVTLTFSNYSDSTYEGTISGTVSYYVYHSSYSTAYSYSDSFNKGITGSNVHIEVPANDYDFTIVDDISISLSDKDDNQYMVEGSITSSSGEIFEVD
jgi:hypothetical protein